MKKIISLILASIMCFGLILSANAEDASASLYNIYSDGMLFAQNKLAIFAGTANKGTAITAELYSADGSLISKGNSVTKADGTFEVSFLAPAGSYEEYTVVLKADSIEFARLTNVVFGELWLASGQSNMEYTLAQSRTGREMFESQKKLSKWLRVLLVPYYPSDPDFTYAEPQSEIEGAMWVTGENPSVYDMSAVAYFFAADLMDELDMPIGVLNATIGGSRIVSWLSRDAIDNDAEMKKLLVSDDSYVDLSDWDPYELSPRSGMTVNYNHKISALGNFRPSGLIWYQGESDTVKSDHSFYTKAFDLLHKSYSKHFGYENELMPIIYTQLTAYIYDEDNIFAIPDRNLVFTEFQKARPESRAMITIYDVPLTYFPELGSIHPKCKEEVGERMAFSAMNLVYGAGNSHSAATVKETVIKDGAVYVTLDGISDGLVCTDNELFGFAVCGKDGVYVQAQAKIVSNDTVKVWSEFVTEPYSASYAYCLTNIRSNLYASVDGTPSLPVSPFITDSSVGTHYWTDKPWADCSDEQAWHVMYGSDEYFRFHNTWTADGAEVSFKDNAVNIKSGSENFTAKPLMTCPNGDLFSDIDMNYSYGKMSFYLRNNGTEDVTLQKVKITASALRWYAPEVNDTKDIETVIPADGEWHLVTVDLNTLYLYGNECGVSLPSSRLRKVSDISFEFSGSGESDISIDTIRFAPSEGKTGIRFDVDINNADTLFEKICAYFVNMIGTIISLFKIN